MKIKQTMRLYGSDLSQSVSVYILVIVLICAVALALTLYVPAASVNFSLSGIDSSAMIFLFVVGLNAFKPQLLLLLQNGVSRRSLQVGFHLSALCTVALMTLVDSLLVLLFRHSLGYSPMYAELYGVSALYPPGILWKFCLYLMAAELGFFTTTLYYRMNKALKLLVSIGVPVLLVLVMPLALALLPDLSARFAALTAWYFGQPAHATPLAALLRGSLHLLLTAGLWAGLAWLLARRAPVKAAA